MADSNLRTFLFSEADRILKELVDNKLVTSESHTQITALLKKERDQAQQIAPSAPPSTGEPVTGFPFGPPPPLGYNPYGQQQPGWGPAPVYPYPPAYPVAAPQAPYMPPGPYAPPMVAAVPAGPPPPQQPAPPPEKPQHHEPNKVTQFAQQMGTNVVNSISHGFGASLGMNAGNSLWNHLK
eukprot:jgi/Botrbrau1/12940/Bobra.154_2s0002.1